MSASRVLSRIVSSLVVTVGRRIFIGSIILLTALLLTSGFHSQGLSSRVSLASGPTPSPNIPSDTEPERSTDTDNPETFIVPFRNGTAGVQSNLSYQGPVNVTVSGVGQAAGTQFSDAFYIFTDSAGNPITPVHPTEFFNWTLWINGGPADRFVQPIPPFRDDHIYTFQINAPGGPLTFAVGDTFTSDNTGAYTVTISSQSSGKILNVPLFKQNDSAWGNNEYDHAKTQFTWCGKTMAQCGCVTTSIAMILDYYGVKNPTDGSTTTPATVNEYFKLDKKPAMCTDGSGKLVPGWRSRGYSCADVVWKAAAQYSRDAFMRNRAVSMINLLNGGPITYNAEALRDDINLNTPAILQNTVGDHWFVAKGIIGNTFFINDPAFSRTRLDDPAYGNRARQMVRYMRVSSDFSALVVPIESPNQLLITDSDGRRTGFDPTTSTIVQEIPNSIYYFQQSLADDTGQNSTPPDGVGSYWVSIDTPQAGDYKIEVISPSKEEYSFGVYAYSSDADLTLHSFAGQSTSNAKPSYTFSYSPIPEATAITYQVLIDIKPGGDTNPINPKSKGVIPVAILSTDTFDAATVDPLSVKFGPSGAGETHKRGHIGDVNGDGKLDMMLHFATQHSGISRGITEACLIGKTTDGLDIKGCDSVRIVP